MARNVDLSLNSLMIPGLSNYENEFGTKVESNRGLSTQQAVDNDLMAFRHQRAIIADENLTCTDAERDAKFLITAGDVTVTLTKASYAGCELLFIADFEGGTSSIVFDREDGTDETVSIVAGGKKRLYSNKNGYFAEFAE